MAKPQAKTLQMSTPDYSCPYCNYDHPSPVFPATCPHAGRSDPMRVRPRRLSEAEHREAQIHAALTEARLKRDIAAREQKAVAEKRDRELAIARAVIHEAVEAQRSKDGEWLNGQREAFREQYEGQEFVEGFELRHRVRRLAQRFDPQER